MGKESQKSAFPTLFHFVRVRAANQPYVFCLRWLCIFFPFSVSPLGDGRERGQLYIQLQNKHRKYTFYSPNLKGDTELDVIRARLRSGRQALFIWLDFRLSSLAFSYSSPPMDFLLLVWYCFSLCKCGNGNGTLCCNIGDVHFFFSGSHYVVISSMCNCLFAP